MTTETPDKTEVKGDEYDAFLAPNIVAERGVLAVRRGLFVLLVLLVLIEAVVFLTPKIAWVVAPDWAYASWWPINQPFRNAAIDLFAFHPIRDFGNLSAPLDVLNSIEENFDAFQPVLEAEDRLVERQIWACGHVADYERVVRNYNRNDCALLIPWLQENGAWQPVAMRWWTPFTAIFLHGGLLHIALNAVALFAFAQLPAMRMGMLRFLLFFIAAGVVGYLLHWGIRGALRGIDQPVVGASGAIMGCVGYHWRVLYDRCAARAPAFRTASPGRQLWRQIKSFLWIDLMFILFAGFISGEAHIGGLLFGFLAAPLFIRSPERYHRWLKRQKVSWSAPITKA